MNIGVNKLWSIIEGSLSRLDTVNHSDKAKAQARLTVACSVANTVAKPQNWATFDPAAAGKKLAPRFANAIHVNVISMG